MDNDPIKPPNVRCLMTTTGSTPVGQLAYVAINAMGRIGQISSSISTVWSSTLEYDVADQLTRANTSGTVAPADNRYSYDLAANVEQCVHPTGAPGSPSRETGSSTKIEDEIRQFLGEPPRK